MGWLYCRTEIHEVKGYTGDSQRAQETHKRPPLLGPQIGVFVKGMW